MSISEYTVAHRPECSGPDSFAHGVCLARRLLVWWVHPMCSLVCDIHRVHRQPLLILALGGFLWGLSEPTLSGSPITNVLQLSEVAASGQRESGVLQMEGTVLWASAAEGRAIFQDDSGTAQMELDLPCEIPRQGRRLRLEGDCTMVKMRDAIKLSSVPVVDSDGLHAAVEKSGSVYLKAGRHPIRGTWFNRTDRFELEVGYEGPGVSRQRIPDAVLFRMQRDLASGATNFVNGLDYRCCEGLWWSLLPNLNHLPAVKSGVARNFDLELKSRNEQVSLQFSGYIVIAQEGLYTFYTKSDDGSCLFLGNPSLRITGLGTAPLPTPRLVSNGASAPDAEDYHWSEVEGTVISVNRLQDSLEIEIATGSGRVRLKVAEISGCSFSLVPQNRIRAIGVCRTILRLDGTKVPGEFYVQAWKDIEQRYVTPELWSIHPLLTVSNAMVAAPRDGSQPVVHLRGRVVAAEAGESRFLEDESGRIALEATELGSVGRELSEVLGRLSVAGTNPVLRCGFFRRVWGNSGESGVLPVLTTAEQVHQLSPSELKRGYPVKLRAVVTSVLQGDAVVVQDATRGIYVSIGKPFPLQAGDYCELEGVTAPGEFSPYVRASRMESLGFGALPNPVQPTWDQLLNGSLHCQYVELEGVITAMDTNTITLLTRDGNIKVQLDAMASPLPKTYQNALVRLRGCLFASWDKEAQRVEVGNIRLNHQWVNVIQLAPMDPFAMPTKKVGDLLRFDPQAGALQRVKIAGQIIHQAGAEAFLMDGEKGLRFNYAGEPTAHVCDVVEVVGFPDLSGPSPILREAVVRRQGLGELPQPRMLDPDNLVRDEYDSTLVRVDGVLLGVSTKPDETVLEIQSVLRRFVAVVKDKAGLEGALTPGSRLELTGVYVGQGGNRVLGRPIDTFELRLNTGFDVRVLSRPPWWTLGRLLAVVGLLAGVLTAALVWIKLLQRKVDQRTQQLEKQIQERQRAERQREIEQERARVAHDLHDDLGAGLTEVNMLTSLVKSPATSAEEKIRYVDELSGLAGRMVTSLDEIVWAVNPRNDTAASLASYFGSYAQRLLELASVSCGLDVAEDLTVRPLDPKFRQELFLAFKEALTNVLRHAHATKVWLRISVQDDALTVIVADDGCGFELGKWRDGADGLANMRERMSALGGSCVVQSEPGKGTTVRLSAPFPKALL